MAENDTRGVISGGLVVPMRPQISVELLVHGDVLISTATVADDFQNVEIQDVRFPIDCARTIADELYRLAELSESGSEGGGT